MAISSDRARQLLQIYNELKEKLNKIDSKYSIEYVEPSLDMPESLNLVKQQYTAKTEAELRAAALQKATAEYDAKKIKMENARSAKFIVLARRKSALTETYRVKRNKLLQDYNDGFQNILRKLANNGLYFSSLQTKWNNEALSDYNSKTAELNLAEQNEMNIIDAEQNSAQNSYDEYEAYLLNERDGNAEAYYKELLEEENEEKIRVDKYNNSLEEKEQKYQAARAKAYEQARQAEYDRAYKMAKLYAELGESGVNSRKLAEKYNLCQQTFYPLTREEGQMMLRIDSALRTHLYTSYSAFEDWVNTTLQ